MMIQQNITPLKIVLPVLAVYFAITLFGILHHEIWLDEAQHFLIARDSTSISTLFTNMKYDGHVQLWNYLLFFITHYISTKVIALQVFHLLIVNAAAFVLLRYAPFSLLVKILVLTGYYFLFEYSLISRNYAMGILFLFTACAFIGRKDRQWIVAIMCLLMCVTHLFFLFAATGLLIYTAYNSITVKKAQHGLVLIACCYAVGVLLAFAQMRQIPPDNTYFHPEKVHVSDLKNPSYTIYGISRGFLPMQNISDAHPWGTYAFDRMNRFVKVLVSLSLLAYPFFLLRRNRAPLLFFYTTALLLLAFFFISQMLASRYFGMYFIFLLAALWLQGKQQTSLPSIPSAPLLRLSFYCMLLLQVVAGIYAYAMDARRPFSLGESVAGYIKGHYKEDIPIVMDGYGGGPAVSAYLQDRLYYMDIGMQGSYCIWKRSYFPIPRKPIEDEFLNLNIGDKFVMVSTRDLAYVVQGRETLPYTIKPLTTFANGIIKPDYYLYEVQRNNR